MTIRVASLLKDFLKFPEISEVWDNPDKYHITPEATEKWEEMMASVLKEGIQGEIIKNLTVREYDKFNDGVATEIVGKAKFEVACVVKAGQEDIKKQNDFMRSFEGKNFFPKVLCEDHINGKWICLMENLAGYNSLHEYIFKTEASSQKEIKYFLDYYYQWIGEICSSYYSSQKPILFDIYQSPRLTQRINEARERLKVEGMRIFSLDIDTLLAKRIIMENEELLSFDELIEKIYSMSDKIQAIAPEFSTFVHGDAHPANIMLLKQPPHFSIKLIDPNPSLKGSSDYIYDQGKMFHWLDMMGFAVLERTFKERLFEFEYNNHSAGQLKIDIKWLSSDKLNLQKIKEYRDVAYNSAMKGLSSLATRLNDKNWEKRLPLAIASAYLGGLPRLKDQNHLSLLYLRGLKYLNQFVRQL